MSRELLSPQCPHPVSLRFSAVVREVEPAVCQEPAPPTESVIQENQSSGEQEEEEKVRVS